MSKRDDTALADQLETGRRRPLAGGTPVPKDAAALLGGVLVGEDEVLHGDPGLDDEVTRKAVVLLRQQFNRHGCTRVRPEDPPCRHQNHYRDVALLRGILIKLGLPGDASLLAPPEGQILQRSVAGMTIGQVIQLAADERIPAGAVFGSLDDDAPAEAPEPVLTWRVEDDGG